MNGVMGRHALLEWMPVRYGMVCLLVITFGAVGCVHYRGAGSDAYPDPVSDHHELLELFKEPLPQVIQVRLGNRFLGFDQPADFERTLEFVLVPAGLHRVEGIEFVVDAPFYISKTVLSIADVYAIWRHRLEADGYEDFCKLLYAEMEAIVDPSDPEFENLVKDYLRDPDHPYLGPSLTRTVSLLREMSVSSGLNMRLPTIGEWFAAMRGGTETRFWWGDDWEPERTVYAGATKCPSRALSAIRRVNEGSQSPLGLYHMLGNVSQMVFPSARERALLRREFGPQSKRRDHIVHGGSVLLLTEHTFLSFGSSIDDRVVTGKRAVGLAMRIRGQKPRIPRSNYWFYFYGIRPVIDIPPPH